MQWVLTDKIQELLIARVAGKAALHALLETADKAMGYINDAPVRRTQQGRQIDCADKGPGVTSGKFGKRRATGTLCHGPQGQPGQGHRRKYIMDSHGVIAKVIDHCRLATGKTMTGKIKHQHVETGLQCPGNQLVVEAHMIEVTVHQQQVGTSTFHLPAMGRQAKFARFDHAAGMADACHALAEVDVVVGAEGL